MVTTLLLIAGFVLLIKGADYLVEGSSSIAKWLNVPNLVIGLTIVAFGTSMPELVVNIFASLRGNADISIGNVVGSNIVNLLFILGLSATLSPVVIKKSTTFYEIPLTFLAGLVLYFMANDILIDKGSANILTRIDGLMLLSFFMIFLYYTINLAKAGNESNGEPHKRPLWLSGLMTLGGLAGLIIGGRWVVDSAITIARLLGVSEALIGLTIVAIGTSLPELVTSAVAAYKKHSDIAVGNIVGSNIFNIFFILGVSGTIAPTPFNSILNFDVVFYLIATLFLFIFCFTPPKGQLSRKEGMIFILAYIGYIAFIAQRG